MDDLESKLKYLMANRTEDAISEAYDVPIEEAKAIIKGIGFAEYLRLSEASADFGNQSNQGAGATPGAGSNDNDDMFDPDGTLRRGRNAQGAKAQVDLDGAMHDITVGRSYGNDVEVTTADGKKMRVPSDSVKKSKLGAAAKSAAGVAAAVPGGFMKGFNKGYQMVSSSQEHDELNRLRELAGIEETCSAGATGAGSIAAAPSVVGNTAHTPTDQLRAKLRRKKEKKK
jgi:hypothetical protein